MNLQMVYVLSIITPGHESRPALFGSLKSAKDTAGIAWRGEGQGALIWTDDEEHDSSEATPVAGVRFVITMEAVRP